MISWAAPAASVPSATCRSAMIRRSFIVASMRSRSCSRLVSSSCLRSVMSRTMASTSSGPEAVDLASYVREGDEFGGQILHRLRPAGVERLLQDREELRGGRRCHQVTEGGGAAELGAAGETSRAVRVHIEQRAVSRDAQHQVGDRRNRHPKSRLDGLSPQGLRRELLAQVAKPPDHHSHRESGQQTHRPLLVDEEVRAKTNRSVEDCRQRNGQKPGDHPSAHAEEQSPDDQRQGGQRERLVPEAVVDEEEGRHVGQASCSGNAESSLKGLHSQRRLVPRSSIGLEV